MLFRSPEVVRETAGVRARERAEGVGARVDGAASGGLTAQEGALGDGDAEIRGGLGDERVVDADERTAGVEENGFEVRGEQVSGL